MLPHLHSSMNNQPQIDNDEAEPDANVIPSPLAHQNNSLSTNNQTLENLHRYFSSLNPHHIYTNNTDPILNFACLNVKGLNSPTKQNSLSLLFKDYNLTFLGLTETKLSPSAARFIYNDNPELHTYWASSSDSHNGGVGFIISDLFSQHLQKVRKWKGRIISADFYFSQFRLRLIVTYYPPVFKTVAAEINKELSFLLHDAKSSNFRCIVLGDFNTDPDNSGRHYKPHEPLLRLFSQHDYIEYPIMFNGQPLPTFQNANNQTSRIDHIWHSPNFVAQNLIVNHSLHQVDAFIDSLDHYMLLHQYDFSTILSTLSASRLKSKGERRKLILYNKVTRETWEKFVQVTENGFRSSFPPLSINGQWDRLKNVLLSTDVYNCFEVKYVSNTHYQTLPDDIERIRKDLNFLSKCFKQLTESHIINRTTKLTRTDLWKNWKPELTSLKSFYQWNDSYHFCVCSKPN